MGAGPVARSMPCLFSIAIQRGALRSTLIASESVCGSRQGVPVVRTQKMTRSLLWAVATVACDRLNDPCRRSHAYLDRKSVNRVCSTS